MENMAEDAVVRRWFEKKSDEVSTLKTSEGSTSNQHRKRPRITSAVQGTSGKSTNRVNREPVLEITVASDGE